MPYTIAIDGAGDMYVTDVLNHRIQKFGPTGRFIARYGHNGGDGTPGTAPGEFEEPYGVATRLPLERLRHRGGHGSRPEARRRRTRAPRCPPEAAVTPQAADRAAARGALRVTVACDRPCSATVHRRDHRRARARALHARGAAPRARAAGAGRPRSGSR